MNKDTLELKVILLWRKHLRVCKPFLDYIGSEPSLLLELALSWAIAYFMVFIFLSPRTFAELSYVPVRGTLKIRRNDIPGN